MFRRLLLLLLLVGVSFSIDINNCTSQVVLDQNNTVYDVIANLNYTGVAAGSACILINATNVTLNGHNYNITGNQSSGVYGIRLYRSDGVTVTSCNVYNFSDAAGIILSSTNNSIVKNNNVYNNSYYGIYVTLGRNNSVDYNTVYNNSVAGIVFASGNHSATGNTAYKNSVGIYLAIASDNTVRGNVIANNSGYGLYLYASSNNNITSNSFENNTLSSIYLELYSNNNNISYNTINKSGTGFIVFFNNSHGNTYAWNNMSNDAFSVAVYLDNSTANILRSNNITNTKGTGIYLANSSLTNITDNEVRTSSGYNGVYLLQSPNNTMASNNVFSNMHSFYIDTSNNNTFFNNSAHGSSDTGFYFTNSHRNNITSNRAYDNDQYGFRLNVFQNNTLSGNDAYNNSATGFYLTSAFYNLLTGNRGFNNSQYGFVVAKGADSNNLTHNLAYNNSIHGFNVAGDFTYLLNNSAYNNTQYGFWLQGASLNNSMINNSAYNNSDTGIYIQVSHSGTITGNSAMDNAYNGFNVASAENNTFRDNYAFDNGDYGFYLDNSKYNIINGTTSNDNGHRVGGGSGHGIGITSTSQYNNFSGIVVFNNGWSGVGSDGSTNRFINVTAFNNTFYGVQLATTSSDNYLKDVVSFGNAQYGVHVFSAAVRNVFNNTFIYNQTQYLFQQAFAAQSNNFTNITFGYNASIGLVNYQFLNITAMYLNSSNFILNPDWVSLNDSEVLIQQANKSANITIYTGDCAYPIWKKSGFPVTFLDIVRNGSVYTTTRYSCLGASAPFTIKFNVSGFSGYALDDVQGCVNLSDSSTWGTRIVNDTSGVLNVNRNTTLCRDTYYLNAAAATAMLRMNSSNIFLDCNLSTIDGVDANGYGIYMTGKENNTVENCTVRNYQYGFYILYSAYARVTNSAAFNNSFWGFRLSASNFSTIDGNIAYNNSLDGFFLASSYSNNLTNNSAFNNSDWGFVMSSSNYTILANNSAYGNLDGIYLSVSSYATLADNSAYGNRYGFRLGDSHYNGFTGNSAYNNTQYGFYLTGSNYNNITNSSAYNNSQQGFYFVGSNYNQLFRNTAYNCTAGFELFSSSSYNNITECESFNNSEYGFNVKDSQFNRISDSRAYINSQIGFMVWSSSNTTLTNNTAFSNAWDGFAISFSFPYPVPSDNVLANNTAYNNSVGFVSAVGQFNDLINNTAFNNSAEGFSISASNYTALTNNTAYNNNVGFYLTSSYYNTLADNTAFDNYDFGFLLGSSAGNTLANSLAYGNAGGIKLADSANYNAIRNATSHSNGGDGFYLWHCIDNNLTDIIAYNNTGYGVEIDQVSVSVRSLFNNTFIYNQSAYLKVNSGSALYQNNFTNLTLGYNSTIGLVNYLEELHLTGVDLYTNWGSLPSSTIILWSDFVSMDDAAATEANKSANITISTTNCSFPVKVLAGLPTSSAQIIANGVVYLTDKNCVTPTLAVFNVSGFSGFALGQTPTILTLAMLPVSTVTYPTQTNVSCNASNSEVLISLYNNASGLVDGPQANYVEHVATLAAGIYNYTCNTSGNANYTAANISGLLTVNRNTSTCSLTFDPMPPPNPIYGTPINASCTCTNPEGAVILWRNGIDVNATENNQFVVIPGGTWNYICNVTQTENYTNASDSYFGYVVDRNTTSITSFTATPVPATVGNETNISCAVDNPQAEITIYQNGTAVAGPFTNYAEYIANLSAGSYEFICNSSGNENYTDVTGTLYYTVDKIVTTLTLTPDPGWTVIPNTATNVSCDSSNPVVPIELYRDNVLMDSGFGHVEDVPGAPLAIGSYVYVCNTTGAENYTSATSTNTLNVRSPSDGGRPEECSLDIIMDREIPVGIPAGIQLVRNDGTHPSNVRMEIWRNVAGSEHQEFYTNGDGHLSYTPSETGGFTIAAYLYGCDGDGTFTVYAPTGEATATFEPSCEGSVVTVSQTVCTGGETDGGGFLECMDVPVEDALVSIYRCQENWETAGAPENTCSELIDTLTTDETGEAVTYERDGHVRIVADLRVATHFVGTTIFGDLPDSAQCPPPAQQLTINFDPACEGSTITVTTTQCIQQDISGAPPICSEVPIKGASVEIYCCPSLPAPGTPTSAVGCTLADSGATSSSGTLITNARDCEASINVRSDSASASTTATLPSTQDCAECLVDSDCPEGYVCRDNECIQEETPPDERRCSADPDCTQGYRCSGGMCTQIRTCTSDQDCGSGQGCLEGICYTDEEIEIITGGEGGVEGGGIAGMLKNIFDVIVRSSWLILLLIVALLLFWFFYWKRRRKKKPLTQEEMIGKEQEFGRRPPMPPRPPRTTPRR